MPTVQWKPSRNGDETILDWYRKSGYLDEVNNLHLNIGKLVHYSLFLEHHLEQLLVMLLNPEIYNSHDLVNFFDSRCVPFNTKIELLRNIRKDHRYINEQLYKTITTLITKLQKMAQIRNKFVHGLFWFDATEKCFCLKYWSGNKAKTDILTEEYLNDIEILLMDIDNIYGEIFTELPEEAWKYYDPTKV